MQFLRRYFICLCLNDFDKNVYVFFVCTKAGVLQEEHLSTPSDEECDVDPLQPIKRRRMISTDPLLGKPSLNYSKRIMCRPPIRRMLNK